MHKESPGSVEIVDNKPPNGQPTRERGQSECGEWQKELGELDLILKREAEVRGTNEGLACDRADLNVLHKDVEQFLPGISQTFSNLSGAESFQRLLAIALQKDRPDVGSLFLSRWAECHPSFDSYFARGIWAWRFEKDAAGARQAFERAGEIDPKNPLLFFPLELLYYSLGEYDALVGHYSRYHEIISEDYLNFYLALLEWRRSGDLAKAERALSTIPKGSAFFYPSTRIREEIALATGAPLDALVDRIRTVHDLTSSPAGKMLRRRFLAGLSLVKDLPPQTLRNSELVRDLQGDSLGADLLEGCFLRRGDIEACIEAKMKRLERTLVRGAGPGSAVNYISKLSIEIAFFELFFRNSPQQAIPNIEKLSVDWIGRSELDLVLIGAYLQAGNFQSLAYFCERMLMHEEDSAAKARWLRIIARVQKSLSQSTKALDYLKKSAAVDSGLPGFRVLWRELASRHAWDELVSLLTEQANRMESEPLGSALLMEASEIHGSGESFEKAIPLLRKALEFAPSNQSAWIKLYRMLLASGRLKEAIAITVEIEKLADTDSERRLWLLERADLMAALPGLESEAMGLLRKMLNQEPSNREVFFLYIELAVRTKQFHTVPAIMKHLLPNSLVARFAFSAMAGEAPKEIAKELESYHGELTLPLAALIEIFSLYNGISQSRAEHFQALAEYWRSIGLRDSAEFSAGLGFLAASGGGVVNVRRSFLDMESDQPAAEPLVAYLGQIKRKATQSDFEMDLVHSAGNLFILKELVAADPHHFQRLAQFLDSCTSVMAQSAADPKTRGTFSNLRSSILSMLLPVRCQDDALSTISELMERLPYEMFFVPIWWSDWLSMEGDANRPLSLAVLEKFIENVERASEDNRGLLISALIRLSVLKMSVKPESALPNLKKLVVLAPDSLLALGLLGLVGYLSSNRDAQLASLDGFERLLQHPENRKALLNRVISLESCEGGDPLRRIKALIALVRTSGQDPTLEAQIESIAGSSDAAGDLYEQYLREMIEAESPSGDRVSKLLRHLEQRSRREAGLEIIRTHADSLIREGNVGAIRTAIQFLSSAGFESDSEKLAIRFVEEFPSTATEAEFVSACERLAESGETAWLERVARLAVAAFPHSTALIRSEQRVLAKRGDWQSLETALRTEASRTLNPERAVDIQLELASIYHEQLGDPVREIQSLQAGVDFAPSRIDLVDRIIERLLEQGESALESTIEWCKRKISIRKEYFAHKPDFDRNCFDDYRKMGAIYEAFGKIDEASTCYEGALEFGSAGDFKTDVEAVRRHLISLHSSLYQMLEASDFEKRAEMLRRMCRLAPTHAKIRQELIQVLWDGQQDRQAALAEIRELFHHSPLNLYGLRKMAEICGASGDFERKKDVTALIATYYPPSEEESRLLAEESRKPRRRLRTPLAFEELAGVARSTALARFLFLLKEDEEYLGFLFPRLGTAIETNGIYSRNELIFQTVKNLSRIIGVEMEFGVSKDDRYRHFVHVCTDKKGLPLSVASPAILKLRKEGLEYFVAIHCILRRFGLHYVVYGMDDAVEQLFARCETLDRGLADPLMRKLSKRWQAVLGKKECGELLKAAMDEAGSMELPDLRRQLFAVATRYAVLYAGDVKVIVDTFSRLFQSADIGVLPGFEASDERIKNDFMKMSVEFVLSDEFSDIRERLMS